jgi:hypothetical protein
MAEPVQRVGGGRETDADQEEQNVLFGVFRTADLEQQYDTVSHIDWKHLFIRFNNSLLED